MACIFRLFKCLKNNALKKDKNQPFSGVVLAVRKMKKKLVCCHDWGIKVAW